MLLRDYLQRVGVLKDRTGRKQLTEDTKANLVSPTGKDRRQDFAPLVVLPTGKPGGVWGYDGFTIFRYTDAGVKDRSMSVPADMEQKLTVQFRESNDGWLYGFFGTSTKLERVRITGPGLGNTLERETLIDPVSDAIPFVHISETRNAFGDMGDGMLVGPDGSIYVKHGIGVSPMFHSFNSVTRYKKLTKTGSTWSFVDPALSAYHPLAWEEWADVVFSNPAARYFFRRKNGDQFRLRHPLLPAITKANQWIAADPIPLWHLFPGDDSENDNRELEWEIFVSDAQYIVVNSPSFVYGTSQSATARVFGNAWWTRSAYDQAWVAGANGGDSQAGMTLIGDWVDRPTNVQSGLRESPASSSGHKAARLARIAGGAILPTITYSRSFWYTETNDNDGLTDPKPVNTGVPFQQGLALLVDKSNTYYVGDDDDFSQLATRLHLYKRSGLGTPTVGSWNQIIALPDVHDTEQRSMQSAAVSATRLWVVDHRPGPAGTRPRDLRIYDKTGTLKKTISDTPLASYGEASLSLCLTAVFQGRWQ